MIPVDQDRFGLEEGNCLNACIASLLELPLAEVEFPPAIQRNWVRPLQDWLAARGLCYSETPAKGVPYFWLPGPLCVLSGPGPRLPAPHQHAVVGRVRGYAFELLHDPHPSRAGLLDVEAVGFLLPLDPAALARRP